MTYKVPYITAKMIFTQSVSYLHPVFLLKDFTVNAQFWERSGSMVECLTRDREAAGSSLTGITALWSWSKTHLS